ncbi:DUF503 domain-containing protein [Geomicrobium sediminis]|uniref:DUF503 domain-containing protein n=1 Tax=Geomicrobium sediminis TaxID=1347788 RepID=UPI0014758992|nr:hypothetical protein DH09_04945 [Bacillaceae bacterium JMAK1]
MIGVIHLECSLPDSHSLKEKRSVLQSILTRARKRNLSVSEMDKQDAWQRTVLSAACVSNDKTVIEKELRVLENMIEMHEDIECISISFEWL